MTFFCENCGSKLPSDAAFCENCGASVTPAVSGGVDTPPITINVCDALPTVIDAKAGQFKSNLTLFGEKSWAKDWQHLINSSKKYECGIILTNTADCPKKLLGEYLSTLEKYIEYRAQEKVIYYVLDVANQCIKRPSLGESLNDVEFDVKLLKRVCEYGIPDYVFIIGDREAIGSAKWKNEVNQGDSGDRDRYVDSDIPYCSLDTNSLFAGSSFCLKMYVGRIPSSAKNGFAEAIKYLQNTMRTAASSSHLNAMVLSAPEWQRVSHLNYDATDPQFYTCPDYSFVPESNLNLIDRNSPYNLLCFNLHGTNVNDYWYSGDGSPAYSPMCLTGVDGSRYVIATEACYGAKPVIRESGCGQSTLVSAISGGAIAFLGSTQIAYGGVDSFLGPCNADVMVGEFAKHVAYGYTLGYAYSRGIKAIISDGIGKCRGEEIKTLCTFALYADPSLTLLSRGSAHAKALDTDKSEREVIHRIKMPDVRAIVEKKLASVTEKMRAKLFGKLGDELADIFAGMTPKYYSVSDGGYKAVYSADIGAKNDIDRIMSVYFDEIGTIDKVFVSR